MSRGIALPHERIVRGPLAFTWMRMVKVGLLGGSFDPIHVGHLRLAQEALQALGLDQVWLLPAHKQPLKEPLSASPEDRLAMCRLAVEGCDWLSVCEMEVARPGPSYSVDTLRALRGAYPDHEWTFIAGTDAVMTLPSWREPERFLDLCHLAVVERGGVTWERLRQALPADTLGKIRRLDLPVVEVSSTQIREDAEGNLRLLPQKVAEYIRDHKLYQR